MTSNGTPETENSSKHLSTTSCCNEVWQYVIFHFDPWTELGKQPLENIHVRLLQQQRTLAAAIWLNAIFFCQFCHKIEYWNSGSVRIESGPRIKTNLNLCCCISSSMSQLTQLYTICFSLNVAGSILWNSTLVLYRGPISSITCHSQCHMWLFVPAKFHVQVQSCRNNDYIYAKSHTRILVLVWLICSSFQEFLGNV